MKTLEFLSKQLSSPIVSHGNRAINVFVKTTLFNPKAVDQLKKNLQLKNLDIVTGSLKIILAIALRDSSKIFGLSKVIFNLGKKSDHFEIVFLCKEILVNTKTNVSLAESLKKRLNPRFESNNSMETFFADCDHFIEYKLGNLSYKYVLSQICNVFEYDCGRAFKKVKRSMVILGYKNNKKYWKERPQRWKHDFNGNFYEIRLNYYARHALSLFLMWCVGNLVTSEKSWTNFLINRQRWDPSIPEFSIDEKPNWLVFKDLNMDVEAWFKMRIKKEEAYELLNLNNVWVPLYENTYFKGEDKSFNRYMATCFVKRPIGKISKKMKFSPPQYSCDNCQINDLNITALEKGIMRLNEYSYCDFLKGKLLPTFGAVSEDCADYAKIFPAPEIIRYFKLKQKKNLLEYYKGKECIIRYINWRGGYRINTDNRGIDQFESANYGYLLMIKSRYLKKYMQKNNLKLMAVGSISKYKIKGRGYEYDPKNSKCKWLPIEILK